MSLSGGEGGGRSSRQRQYAPLRGLSALLEPLAHPSRRCQDASPRGLDARWPLVTSAPARPTEGQKGSFPPQKGLSSPPATRFSKPSVVSTLLSAARGSVRCTQPPAHRDTLAQPSGSRRATPSRRLTRHVSTSTGAPNTSHTRTQSLVNNLARVCCGLFL